MNIKLAACLLGLALLVAALFFLVRGGGREGSGRGDGAAKAVSAPELTAVDQPLADADALPAAASAAVAREKTVSVAEVAPSNDLRSELAGLTGRVVENDGKVVPGIRVALLELDSIFLFDGSMLGEEPPKLEIEETLTDSEGRFHLGGARGPAFHGLGVDLGGARSTLRVLDHALTNRERTDVGDVVLAPFGVVTGRVVDDKGAPVSGARVRMGPFPPEILRGTPWEFRSQSLIAIGPMAVGGEDQTVIDVPDWVRREIDRLPIPTTISAADGTFRLEGVALAQIVGGVDKAGYVGAGLGPFDLTDGEHDVGAIVLERGRTVRGVVEDAYGEAAVGVEVFAGAELVPGIVSILQPCGLTDENGKFELAGVPLAGQIVAVARRAKHEPWHSTVTARHEAVLIEIESTVKLTVLVKDQQGEPLSGARIQLKPGRRPSEQMDVSQFLMVLPRPATPEGTFQEVEPGRYVNASLGAGLYEIQARAPGRAPAFQLANCEASENEFTLVCPGGSRVEVRVLDSASKVPIQGASATILRASSSGFTKVAAGTTDAEGRAQLGPLPDFDASEKLSSFFPAETMVVVRHPRYGDYSAKCDPDVPTLLVELQSGGILTGRVHWGGAVPTRPYMLSLEYRDADGFLNAFHMPRFTVTDLAGEFRLTNLHPGKYTAELMERFLNNDPLGMMNDQFDVATLHREEITIQNGETTELVIDLTPTGRGTTASVRGHVRLDGRNLEGAEVRVSSNETVRVTTDSSGRFETPAFAVRGQAHIQVTGDVRLGDRTRRTTLHSSSVELVQDQVYELDLDLYPLTVRVQVLDAVSGEPIEGAEVAAQAKEHNESRGFRDETPTGSDGEATLMVLGPGEYNVTASAEGFGRSSTAVTVPAEGFAGLASVSMPRSVPCAGHVQPDAAAAESRGFAYVHFQREDGPGSAGTMLKAPDYAFSVDGLAPGKYRAQMYLGGREGKAATVVLGPEGDRDLVLEFVPDDGKDKDEDED